VAGQPTHIWSSTTRPGAPPGVPALGPRGGPTLAVPCRVSVVDNGSSDGSIEELASEWPGVGVVREPNRGCVVSTPHSGGWTRRSSSAQQRREARGGRRRPLLSAIEGTPTPSSPRPSCWTFAASNYEGCGPGSGPGSAWSRGSAGPGARVPGRPARPHGLRRPVLAVHAGVLELGGYDPIFFPGG